MENGLHIVYLPVNQCWALCWHEHVLGLFMSKTDAETEKGYLLRK